MIEYGEGTSYESESTFWPPAGIMMIMMMVVPAQAVIIISVVGLRNYNYSYDRGNSNC